MEPTQFEAGTLALHAAPDVLAFKDIEGGEQDGGAIALVIVGPGGAAPLRVCDQAAPRKSSAFSMPSSASAGQQQSGPRGSKQLRHPQASKGNSLAAAASALHFPFHPTSCSWADAVKGLFAKLTRPRLK